MGKNNDESDDGRRDADDDGSGEGSGGFVLEDLQWRVDKMRLEEANTRHFLKAGPRFLPYEECRKWVKAWSLWDSEEDWRNWIELGETRNSYIPARPDEYYGKLGKWKSWDHFLGKIDDNDIIGEFD